jgi:hypothetical protein
MAVGHGVSTKGASDRFDPFVGTGPAEKRKICNENDVDSPAEQLHSNASITSESGLMGRTIDSLPTYDKTIIPASSALR